MLWENLTDTPTDTPRDLHTLTKNVRILKTHAHTKLG